MNIETYRYYYNYAIIDKASKMCIEICTCTYEQDGYESETEFYVRIPTYNDEYGFKYYDRETNRWFYDSAMQNEWIPPVS